MTSMLTVTVNGGCGTANGFVDTSVPQSESIVITKLHPWHNVLRPLDVTGAGGLPDGHVVPGDALVVINYLNSFVPITVPATAEIGQPFGFLDVDGDNHVAPVDALMVINVVNAG